MFESTKDNTLLLVGLIAGVLVAVLILGVGGWTPGMQQANHNRQVSVNQYNQEIVTEKNEGIMNLLAEGRYKCCMKEPCFRCFSKPGAHDKELVCDCMIDIYNGKHPCGECIGEILEGEGNPLMAEYFATAIAEKLGEQHLTMLKQIISEKYGIPAGEQI